MPGPQICRPRPRRPRPRRLAGLAMLIALLAPGLAAAAPAPLPLAKPAAASAAPAPLPLAKPRPDRRPGTGPAPEADAETETGAETEAETGTPPSRPERMQIRFAGSGTRLDSADRGQLDRLAAYLAARPGARLEVRAFAEPREDSLIAGRRVALKRAVAIRDYLVAQGVPGRRVVVRALGAETEETPRDRADLKIVE